MRNKPDSKWCSAQLQMSPGLATGLPHCTEAGSLPCSALLISVIRGGEARAPLKEGRFDSQRPPLTKMSFTRITVIARFHSRAGAKFLCIRATWTKSAESTNYSWRRNRALIGTDLLGEIFVSCSGYIQCKERIMNKIASWLSNPPPMVRNPSFFCGFWQVECFSGKDC